jgi:hypothetical protein
VINVRILSLSLALVSNLLFLQCFGMFEVGLTLKLASFESCLDLMVMDVRGGLVVSDLDLLSLEKGISAEAFGPRAQRVKASRALDARGIGNHLSIILLFAIVSALNKPRRLDRGE